MAKPLNAEDILPLVACLTPPERLRLLRLIVRTGGKDGDIYRAWPSCPDEFSANGEPLAWDSEGWEEIG